MRFQEIDNCLGIDTPTILGVKASCKLFVLVEITLVFFVVFSDDVVEIWWENPAPELFYVPDEADADAADTSKSLRIHFQEKSVLFKRTIVQLFTDERPKGDKDENGAVDCALMGQSMRSATHLEDLLMLDWSDDEDYSDEEDCDDDDVVVADPRKRSRYRMDCLWNQNL